MTKEPLVSLILVVRNGLPFVKEAIDSVRRLAYSNYELIIQDGASTDGTKEFLESLTLFPRMAFVSEPDSGIGQAYNRALKRCSGDIVGSIDADNLLRPDALAIAARYLTEHPSAAAVYGGCRMIDADGHFIHSWMAPEFDLLKLIEGEVVPPFASTFFSRLVCGPELRFDESMPTVADFDLWLRIADRPLDRILDEFCDIRVSSKSSTWRPEAYQLHCEYKLVALRRFLSGTGGAVLLNRIRQRAESGLHLWAVDSLGYIGGTQQQIDAFFEGVTDPDLRSERFRRIISTVPISSPLNRHDLQKRLFLCGVEYFTKHRPAEALLYFDVLKRWGYEDPKLQEWIDRSTKLRDDLLRIEANRVLERDLAPQQRQSK